ncbi:very-short-patch-repair endonuclease [Nocardiopsis arvandica]|uniref:Very-short-patch-repair endonuclease n=1 Tax=Nocardiopsis sinuspersici TaxID=501010 RepID=A0A7Y9X776_9ACTN|nr:DUF4011 domain-containing protein [Nocardiopsis sinuspersici]NYH50451.1 very-short-patch-repair endonuclease [Nocardiopsis sinuspersici]
MDSESREIRTDLSARLELWRTELLDLSRRNRLLNFRHTKASTLDIREPGYTNLLNRLSRGLEFVQLPSQKSEDDDEGESEESTPAASKRGPRTGIVTQRPYQEQLDKSLARLRKQSRTTETETGIWVLYLGVGFLRWKGPNEQEHSEAPLLLVPVELDLTDRGRFRLCASNAAESLLNPALGIKLQEFGIDWGPVEGVPLDEPDQLIEAVRSCVSEQRTWSVEEKVVLALFTFHKETMYRDLEDNEEAILDHPVIRAIASEPGARVDSETLEYELPSLERLDQAQAPETAPLVLEADAYQRRAVAAALDGRSFVLDGPPGTGKSQTIANVISALIGAGRTVLFVSEKAAALEVVQSRLVDIGVDIAALSLHDGKTRGGAVAKALEASLHADVRPLPVNLSEERDKARAIRERLSDHAGAVNDVDPQVGLSLNQAMGRVSLLAGRLPSDTELGMVTPDPDLFTRQARERILGTALSMTHVWDLLTSPESSPWNGIQRAEEAYEALTGALTSLNELDRHHGTLRRLTGGEHPSEPADARRWVTLLEALAERDDVPAHWLVDADFDTAVVPQAAEAVERLADLAWLRTRTEFDWRSVKDLPTLAELDTDAASEQSGETAALAPWTEERTDRGLELCSTWTQRMTQAARTLDEAVRRTGLPEPTDHASALLVASVLAEISSGPHPLPHWMGETGPEQVHHLLSAFEDHRDRLRESRARAQDLFHSGVLEQQDLPALVRRLQVWQYTGRLVTERSEVPAHWLAQRDFDALVRRPALAAWERWHAHHTAVDGLRRFTDLPWQELPDFDETDPTTAIAGLDTEAPVERARTDAQFFRTWSTRLRGATTASDTAAQALGCPRPEHPHQVRAFLEAAVGLGPQARPLPAWLGEETARSAQVSLENAEEAVTELVQAREAASDLFGSQVLDQEGLEELNGRFAGYGRLDRILGSAFREDKRLVSGLTVSGSWDKRVPERLHEAIRWQRAHQRLTDDSAGYQDLLGSHWRGEDTDFASARAALATAGLLRELVSEAERSGLRRFLHQDQPLDPGLVAAARTALDELAPWEETARQLLPAEADLFELPLEQATAWLVSAADRLTADAALIDAITPVVGEPVTTGRARDIREHVLRARSTHGEQYAHEEADHRTLGSYRGLLAEKTRTDLEQDLDWAERASRELNYVTGPVLGTDCVDVPGIESLRELARVTELDEERSHGTLGRACHRDRSLAAALTHTGLWNDTVLDRITDAQRWHEDQQALWIQEASFAQAFGQYWCGEETDPGTVGAALERADLCRRELDSEEREALARFLGHGELTDLREGLEQVCRTLSGWPEAAQALPEGASLAPGLPPAGALAWLEQTRKRLERVRGLLRRFRDATGRYVTVTDAGEDIALARYRAMAEAEREQRERADRVLLGSLYQVEENLGEAFQNALVWSRRVRELVSDAAGTSDPGWPEEAVPAMRVRCDPAELSQAVTDWEKAAEAFTALFDDLVRPVMAGRLSGDLAEAERFLFSLREDVSSLDRWSTALAGQRAVESHGLGPLLERYIGSQGDPRHWPDTVEHAVLRAWTDGRLREDDRVRREPGPVRDDEVLEFRRRDRQLHTWARQQVLNQWSERRPPVGSYSPGLGTIRREAEKKRRHMPVRRLMEEATWEAQLLTPCLMMSPLTVSMFLPSDIRFDVVVFDEASQVKPADAINCVYRGRSLIVAGDQKQLPPTGFFDRVSTDDEWEEDQQESYESLLDMCKASGRMRDIPLRWHYRSRHEDLIAFSNRKFYDSELITFPGARLKDENTGVAYFGVDGVYDRGGARNNRIEADKVAERVIHHFRTRPGQTLGVVAMSREQANAIEAAVDKAIERYPGYRHLVEGDRLGGFFVKNLETVQGDERDVVIFSVGYGPAADGRIRKNFGPLNRTDGHRRLNVAITRAKRRVEVVCSFSADQLRVGPDDAEGLRRLCEYLRYAEQGPVSLEAQPVGDHDEDAPTESPFEDSVLTVLRDWGYEVQPQVGVAGYRIDLGVRHPDLPGRYVLGVECDGAMYHSSKVARDRDRLRDGVLTGLGWRLHRIWGTDWYRDRARAEQRLRAVLEEAVARERSERKDSTPSAKDEAELDGQSDTSEDQRLVTVPKEHLRPWLADRASSKRPQWLHDYVIYNYPLPGEAYAYELRDPEARPHIAGMLVQVAEDESPVEISWLYRRVFDWWGAGDRLGRTIRANFDATLEFLMNEGFLRREGDTIWRPESEVSVRRPTEMAQRRVSEVPPVERQEALRLLVQDSMRIFRKDLLRSMREVFEWKRSGKDITQAFEEDLETLLSKGVLAEEGGVIRPAG